MNHLRGLLRQEGIRLEAEAFRDERVFEALREYKGVPAHLAPVVESYRRSIMELLKERGQLDREISV